MAYEIKDNSGSIFRNDKKQTDNHPDGRGSMRVICPHCGDPSDHWISGWMKRTKDGDPWTSLAFKAKDEQPSVQGSSISQTSSSRAPPPDEPDDPGWQPF